MRGMMKFESMMLHNAAPHGRLISTLLLSPLLVVLCLRCAPAGLAAHDGYRKCHVKVLNAHILAEL